LGPTSGLPKANVFIKDCGERRFLTNGGEKISSTRHLGFMLNLLTIEKEYGFSQKKIKFTQQK